MEQMMQMFLKMREDDSRRELERQERRDREIQDNIKREQQGGKMKMRERREEKERGKEGNRKGRETSPTLSKAKRKSTCCSTDGEHNSNQTKETDDIEAFIRHLEIAFKSTGIDKGKWRHHLLTQLTVGAKEPVVHLLENDDIADYDDIKEALLGGQIMSTLQQQRHSIHLIGNNLLTYH